MAAGLLVSAVGAAVLSGWVFGFEFLKAPVPNSSAMQPLTAAGFVVAGAALAASAAGLSGAVPAAALIALALGSQLLALLAPGADLGMGRLPTPATAGCFLLFGASLLLGGSRNGSAVPAVPGLVLASIPLLGHLYAESAAAGAGPHLSMAVHTAVSFLVLFAGVLSLHPPGWLTRLGGRGPGAATARRLIPVIAGIPVATGWLVFRAADAGLVPERLAAMLVVLATVVILTVVVVLYASRLDRTDAERRESHERLRLAVEGARLGTWEVDLSAGRASWSARYAEMCGLPAGERGGTLATWLGHLHADDRERILSVLHGGEGTADLEGEYRIGMPGGELRWIACHAHVLRDEEGAPSRALGIARDITERKRADERQELLIREVNHRVKNSLHLVNVLLGMQAHQVADGEARRQLQEAAGRVRAVAHLHELLYRGTDVERVDFDAYLRALCDDLRATAPEQAIRVESAPVLLPTDSAVPLGLIVAELVTNSIKHARAPDGNRTIEVRFGPVSDGVDGTGEGGLELEVRDHGIGLPPGFVPERAEGSLGMRIVTGLALGLDADLRAEEAGPGVRWRLRLPPASPAPAP